MSKNESALKEERLYTVFLQLKSSNKLKNHFATVPLATTTTKQRANGFITKTLNLWKEFDMNKDVELSVFEKKGTGKKTTYEPVE